MRNSLSLWVALLFAATFSAAPVSAQVASPGSSRSPKVVSAKNPMGPWDPVLDEGVRAGIGRARLKATAERLAKAGLLPPVGRAVLAAAYDAAKQGLPWDSVLAKLDEGIVKKASPEALVAAGRGRATSLTRGRTLVFGVLGGEGRTLVAPAALALESGVTEAVLQDVLARGKGKPAAQLRPVLEAGEALQLAGFEPEAVEALMGDCLARNLRRQEVLRVVRYAVEKKRKGMPGMAIRQALWDATVPAKKAPAPAPGTNAPVPPSPEAQPAKSVN